MQVPAEIGTLGPVSPKALSSLRASNIACKKGRERKRGGVERERSCGRQLGESVLREDTRGRRGRRDGLAKPWWLSMKKCVKEGPGKWQKPG